MCPQALLALEVTMDQRKAFLWQGILAQEGGAMP
jgi:hypothetical protein